MLRKLIKYDLKSMIKTMLPLWITAIIISLFLEVQTARAMNSPIAMYNTWDSNIILSMVLFCILLAIAVINILFVIQRFWNGLLKDEGYLMFTLPVSVRKLILGKLISAMIISGLSTITALISASVVFIGSGTRTYGDVITYIDTQLSFDMALQIISIVIGLLQLIYRAYAAMAIGQLSNRNRFLCSFGAYIAINIVVSIVRNIIINPLMKHLSENMMTLLGIIIVIAWIFLLHFITEYLLTKKLNLE